VEEMPVDHPLYGMDVDGLLGSDLSWMRTEFLSFYTESTRRSMQSKFRRFEDFCTSADLRAMPAHPSTVYRYIRFLRTEGRVGVRSLPQYLAAISMAHQVAGHLHFSAFDRVTRLLTRAWRRQCPEQATSHAPVPTKLMLHLLALGLDTDDLWTLRATVSAYVDFIFFNRAQSGHFILVEDLKVADGVVAFVERKTKLKAATDPAVRLRSWPSHGAPEVVDLLLRWIATRDRAWADAGRAPTHFYTLPGESDPTSRAVSSWFSRLLSSSPHLCPGAYDHHGLRAGGASACFALEVPELRIRHWGDWRSAAVWKYIDVYRLPTEWDFRLFGWMTITARDLHDKYGHIFCS
jgi:hypothetical protein